MKVSHNVDPGKNDFMTHTLTLPRYESMLQALRKANFRLTPQRMAICRYLAEGHTHPTSDEIFRTIKDQYPSLSRATVYNTIAVLKDVGEIIELPSAAGASVHYEVDLRPHVNLTCIRCGKIYDAPAEEIGELKALIDARTDFLVQDIQVEGHGICAECQQALAEAKPE